MEQLGHINIQRSGRDDNVMPCRLVPMQALARVGMPDKACAQAFDAWRKVSRFFVFEKVYAYGFFNFGFDIRLAERADDSLQGAAVKRYWPGQEFKKTQHAVMSDKRMIKIENGGKLRHDKARLGGSGIAQHRQSSGFLFAALPGAAPVERDEIVAMRATGLPTRGCAAAGTA